MIKQKLSNSKEKTELRNNLWKGEYQVSQTSYLNDEVENTYEKKIRLSLEAIQDFNYHFLYSEYDFLKNGETSDTKASSLSKKCMEIIYPLRFIVSFQGKINRIELTKNVQQISSEMDEIKLFFEDEFSADYIEKMKKLLENSKEVSDKFQNTLLNSFLFSPVYGQKFNSAEKSISIGTFFPWISNANPILFDIENTISGNQKDEDFIIISQTGVSKDYRSYEEVYYLEFENDEHNFVKDTSIDCEYVAEFVIAKENKSLQRIEATFQNFIQENIEKEIFMLERLV